MFLTAQEIEQLTGFERLPAQERWLQEHGYPYDVGGDRVPKVLRSYVERRLGGKVEDLPEREPELRL